MNDLRTILETAGVHVQPYESNDAASAATDPRLGSNPLAKGNENVQTLNTAATSVAIVDPLIAIIDAYNIGNDTFNDWPGPIPDDQMEAIVATTYGPHEDILSEWEEPAQTFDAAIAALRVANREAEEFSISRVLESMLASALAFFETMQPPPATERSVTKVNRLARELSLAMTDWCNDLAVEDGRPDLWKAAIFPSSFTEWPVSFEHIGAHHHFGDRIDTLFHDWRALRGSDAELNMDTPEGQAHIDRYSELQRRIEALTPHTAIEMAMQLSALWDYGANDLLPEFEKRIYEMAGPLPADFVAEDGASCPGKPT